MTRPILCNFLNALELSRIPGLVKQRSIFHGKAILATLASFNNGLRLFFSRALPRANLGMRHVPRKHQWNGLLLAGHQLEWHVERGPKRILSRSVVGQITFLNVLPEDRAGVPPSTAEQPMIHHNLIAHGEYCKITFVMRFSGQTALREHKPVLERPNR